MLYLQQKVKFPLRILFWKSYAAENVENSDDAYAETESELSPFLPALSLWDYVELTDGETQSLVFIAGYVGFEVVRALSCALCQGELVCDKILQYDLSSVDFTYLSDLDRGGLRWPTDFLLEIVT